MCPQTSHAGGVKAGHRDAGPARRGHSTINGQGLARHPGRGEPQGRLPAARAEAVAQGLVAEQADQRAGQRGRVAGSGDQGVLLVAQELVGALAGGGHHGQAAAHGLEVGDPERLHQGRHGEDTRRAVVIQESAVADRPEEVAPTRHAQPLGEAFRALGVVAPADDGEAGVRTMGEHDGERFEEGEQSLALEVPPDEQDGGGRADRSVVDGNPREVEPVGHGREPVRGHGVGLPHDLRHRVGDGDDVGQPPQGPALADPGQVIQRVARGPVAIEAADAGRAPGHGRVEVVVHGADDRLPQAGAEERVPGVGEVDEVERPPERLEGSPEAQGLQEPAGVSGQSAAESDRADGDPLRDVVGNGVRGHEMDLQLGIGGRQGADQAPRVDADAPGQARGEGDPHGSADRRRAASGPAPTPRRSTRARRRR